jgi:hypothetical protein
MNAGLSNLANLKAHLLPPALLAEATFDATILGIGRGVAGMFDSFCNRSLAYSGSASCIFTGCRDHYILPRYPIVGVPVLTMRQAPTDAWDAVTGEPLSMNEESGMLRFGGVLGDDFLQVKAVWAGGFWVETAEPGDEGFPSSQPEGSTALPDALLTAFYTQCEEAWFAHDRLGVGISEKAGEGSAVAKSDLVPMVRQILSGYIRYQLT